MAAIKRSQASQRRNPDTFQLYHHHQHQNHGGVKIDLRQLVLAILDDPLVSRVFSDAGFRSCDIKLSLLRPLPLTLPPPPHPIFLCASSSDSPHHSRIADVLLRSHNPILIGAGAASAARDFLKSLEDQDWSLLPPELHRFKFIDMEKFLTETSSTPTDLEGLIKTMDCEPGVVVGLGDLTGLAERNENGDGLISIILEMTKLVRIGRPKVRLIGWSATYETYMKLLSSYPALDKEWSLQLLPITTARNGSSGMVSSRPRSFLDSFVPFGGFFPSAYESKYLLNNYPKLVSRCQLCNDKYKEELAAITKGSSFSVHTQDQESLPYWIQRSEFCGITNGLEISKTVEDEPRFFNRMMDLQMKWNQNCQCLHQNFHLMEAGSSQAVSHAFGFPYGTDKEGCGNHKIRNPDLTQRQSSQEKPRPSSVGSHNTSTFQGTSMSAGSAISQPKEEHYLSRFQTLDSKTEQPQRECIGFSAAVFSEGMPPEGTTSPSQSSVMTDLVLGTPRGTSYKENSLSQSKTDHLSSRKNEESARDPGVLIRSYSSEEMDTRLSCEHLPIKNLPNLKDTSSHVVSIEQRIQCSPKISKQFDLKDFKTFYRNLSEKVGWQDEALCTISHIMAFCKSGHQRRRGGNLRGDIWLHFHGPDKVGKRRIAGVLAELVYGSREMFIRIDVSFQDGLIHPNTICDKEEVDVYEARFRGKTTTDNITWALSKKPCSVILLENVDKTDLLVQNSLSQALRTGKFSDSHGRVFDINNNIIVTSSTDHDQLSFVKEEFLNFSEEKILAAQPWKIKIILNPQDFVRSSSNIKASAISQEHQVARQTFPCSAIANKRTLDLFEDDMENHGLSGHSERPSKSLKSFLDLNQPIPGSTGAGADFGDVDNISKSDNSEAWLEEFLKSVDALVKFKPFDFDALAVDITNEISRIFHKAIGSDCQLKVDRKVIEQILAAAWLSEDREALHNWFERVLCRSFTEVRQRYKPSATTLLRLVSHDVLMEDQAPGINLPIEIIFE